MQFLKFRKGPASLPLIRLAIFAMHLLRDQGRPEAPPVKLHSGNQRL